MNCGLSANGISFRTGFEPGVQAARAAAATLVVLVHMFAWRDITKYEQLKVHEWWAWFTSTLRIDDDRGAGVGVFLFFLLSGYIVSQVATVEGRWTFLAKRAARLVPPMVLAVLLTVIVGKLAIELGWRKVTFFNPEHALTWRTLLEAVGLGAFRKIEVLFPLWTLVIEYYWYLLLLAFIPLTRKRPVIGTYVLMACVAGLVLISPSLQFGEFGLNTKWLPYVFVILIGRWIYLLRSGLRLPAAALGIGLTVVAFVGFWQHVQRVQTTASMVQSLASVAWAVLFFCLLLYLVKGTLWAPVNFFAEISYGLYLFHIPVMWVVLSTLSPGGGRFYVPAIALAFAATAGIAWLSHQYFERPIRNWVRGLLSKRPQPAIEV